MRLSTSVSEKRNPVRPALLPLLAIILGVSFLSGSLAHGQAGTGDIVGTVKDATGAVLPGVALTITHASSGQARHLNTDASGNYAALSLPIGEYTIKAELPNFKTQIRQGVVLQMGQQ